MYDQISGQIDQVTAYLHLGEVTIDTPVFKLHYVVRSVGLTFRSNLQIKVLYQNYIIFIIFFPFQRFHFRGVQSDRYDRNLCWRPNRL